MGDFVYLNATGAAVSNSIKVIEYLKRHIKGLHLSYNILSKEFIDEYEPKVEGLDKVTTKRTVSTLEAILSLTKGDQMVNNVGYMAPLEGEVDQEGFEESMKRYSEKKSNKNRRPNYRKKSGEEEDRGERRRSGSRRGR